MVCTVVHEVWKTGRIKALSCLYSIGLLGAVFASLTACTSPEHVDGYKPAYSWEGAGTKPETPVIFFFLFFCDHD